MKSEGQIKESSCLAHPQFFFACGRGKSPPRLHKALVEVNRIKAVVISRSTLPFQLMESNSEAVGPMKPLQGPTPVAAHMDPIPVKSFPIDLSSKIHVPWPENTNFTLLVFQCSSGSTEMEGIFCVKFQEEVFPWTGWLIPSGESL